MMTTMRRVLPCRRLLIVRTVLSFTVFNYSTTFTLSYSTIHLAQVQSSNKLHCSNLPQEVTNGVLAVLFQQYVLVAHTTSQLVSKNPSDTVVFRRRKSSRLQSPMEPEKRSKQQKLFLRTRSLPQLQDRCLMASSLRKGGTWLSHFYHRQAGLVDLFVNIQRSIAPSTLEIFFRVETLIYPISQLTRKLFELGSSRRTCSLVIDIGVLPGLQQECTIQTRPKRMAVGSVC